MGKNLIFQEISLKNNFQFLKNHARIEIAYYNKQENGKIMM